MIKLINNDLKLVFFLIHNNPLCLRIQYKQKIRKIVIIYIFSTYKLLYIIINQGNNAFFFFLLKDQFFFLWAVKIEGGIICKIYKTSFLVT